MFLISGTASILGHESVHPGDVQAQLREALQNVDALLARAHASGQIQSAQLGAQSLVKAYVRHAEDASRIERGLREHLGADVPLLLLAADICRSDLLVEIEVVHGASIGPHGLRPGISPVERGE